jgi:hypothetical protein
VVGGAVRVRTVEHRDEVSHVVEDGLQPPAGVGKPVRGGLQSHRVVPLLDHVKIGCLRRVVEVYYRLSL